MHDRPAPLIEVQPDPDTLATAVAGELLNRIADAQAAGRVPHIGLTGGTIADPVHSQIARMSAGSVVDWGAVHFWFGDERFLPAGSPDRNAGQARGAFLDAVGASRVHEVPAADQVPDAETAAASYSDVVRADGEGAFDVLMLGIGPDGHVASLFPGKPEVEERSRLVAGVPLAGMDPQVPRITLTLPALNAARHVVFLVTGESKRDAVRRVFGGHPDPASPAAHVRPGDGELTVYLDPAAAP